MVAESWLHPLDWYQTNLIAQVKLHDILRVNKELKRYVHVTTPEVYGSTDGWLKESYDFRRARHMLPLGLLVIYT